MATPKAPAPPANYDMWRFMQKARAVGASDAVSVGERVLVDLRAHPSYKLNVYSEKPEAAVAGSQDQEDAGPKA